MQQIGEVWDIGRNYNMSNVHRRDACMGDTCMFHNPTEHSMTDFPYLWRADRGIMERTCPHGVGHPDPDQYDYWEAVKGRNAALAEMVHGCDGCCA